VGQDQFSSERGWRASCATRALYVYTPRRDARGDSCANATSVRWSGGADTEHCRAHSRRSASKTKRLLLRRASDVLARRALPEAARGTRGEALGDLSAIAAERPEQRIEAAGDPRRHDRKERTDLGCASPRRAELRRWREAHGGPALRCGLRLARGNGTAVTNSREEDRAALKSRRALEDLGGDDCQRATQRLAIPTLRRRSRASAFNLRTRPGHYDRQSWLRSRRSSRCRIPSYRTGARFSPRAWRELAPSAREAARPSVLGREHSSGKGSLAALDCELALRATSSTSTRRPWPENAPTPRRPEGLRIPSSPASSEPRRPTPRFADLEAHAAPL